MNDWHILKLIGEELFQDGDIQRAVLKSYKAWVEICTPQRTANEYCEGCPLKGNSDFIGLCGAFQDIGRGIKKLVSEKSHRMRVDISNMETRKDGLSKEVEEFTEYMKEYSCPGPHLYRPLESKVKME